MHFMKRSRFCVVGVEVVSIDAMKKEPNGIIIGIALIKVQSMYYIRLGCVV